MDCCLAQAAASMRRRLRGGVFFPVLCMLGRIQIRRGRLALGNASSLCVVMCITKLLVTAGCAP